MNDEVQHTTLTKLDAEQTATFARTMHALATCTKKLSDAGTRFQPSGNNTEVLAEFGVAFNFLKELEYDLDGQMRGFRFTPNLGLTLKDRDIVGLNTLAAAHHIDARIDLQNDPRAYSAAEARAK